jgi:hypothetical protein
MYLRGRIQALLKDEDNDLGGNLLGYYTSRGGKTYDSIWVGDPPMSFKVSGLEVIIQRIPPRRSGLQLANPDGQGQVKLSGLQTVTLRQHPVKITENIDDEMDQVEMENIEQADDRLVRWFAQFEAVAKPMDDTPKLIYEITYTIPFNWHLTPLGHANTP